MRTLDDLIAGRASLEDITIKTAYDIELIPGGSGTQQLTELDQSQVGTLVESVADQARSKDFILVDTGAGISKATVGFLLAAPEVLVAVSNEPTSLTDAYALIKVLHQNGFNGRLAIFASGVNDSQEARSVYKKISNAAQRFLNCQIDYLGYVLRDEKLPQSVGEQVPVLVRHPGSAIARCYRVLATTLLGQEAEAFNEDKFWTRLLGLMAGVSRPRPALPPADEPETSPRLNDELLRELISEQRQIKGLLERIVDILGQPPRRDLQISSKVARRTIP
ncbi:MAG: Flagellum site-determining protein YlxH [Deltaproteobacteria bacterium ADurb.Bin510]|nr:MAG: Flagellum site-determining protein YlxH [Deltaproteobacteria bacterium ADurb.Bin510]